MANKKWFGVGETPDGIANPPRDYTENDEVVGQVNCEVGCLTSEYYDVIQQIEKDGEGTLIRAGCYEQTENGWVWYTRHLVMGRDDYSTLTELAQSEGVLVK